MWFNTVQAAGFAIIEHSASGMGNAFAGGGAIAEDASTIYFNPAGMTRLQGRQLSGAGHLIVPSSKFSNNGSTTSAATGNQVLLGDEDDGAKNAFVPNFYYVQDINQQWKFGLGINAPFGLEIEYDDDWVGRYHAVKSAMLSLNINPSLAVKINSQLSLGFGVSAQYIDVELSNAIDMGSVCFAQELSNAIPSGTCNALNSGPQQNDGFSEVSGDSWDYGYNVGLLYEFSPTSRLGFHYRSSIEHRLEGDADFTVPGSLTFLTQTGAFTDTSVTANIDLPDSISLSYFQELTPKFALMFDWTVTKWSKFQELRVKFDPVLPIGHPDGVTTEDWDDSNRISVGLNYKLDSTRMLRFGLAHDQTPVPSAERRTPRLPGDDRTWVSVGFNLKPAKNISLDFGYAHLFITDADINNEFESSVPTLEHTLSGSYDATVDIFSAQLNWNF
ncbi:MAG: hypothetical protein GXP08_18020 [Gammaproteobacteria bacterium]|nr:hypothetical protein [Gammaproteobacteria bacterium]